MKKKFKIASIVTALATLFASPAMALAATPIVVNSANSGGWVFNPDLTNSTPYEFNEDEASIGDGSLYVLPLSTDPAKKFIAAKSLNVPVETFNSVSYDFLIAGDGVGADANQFYLNVYTTLPAPNTDSFYNCRFDYVPTTGSITDFTTASFSADTTPTFVASRNGSICPATLEDMPAGSTVSFFSLNLGDTGAGDAGLAGYFDNVVVNTDAAVTTYDFEQDPTVFTSKDACKNGGWEDSDVPVFKNQGDCVSFFASNGKAKGNPVTNFFNSLF